MEWVLMLNEHSCTPFAVNAVCKWKVTDNESIWVVATIRSVENIHLLVIRCSKVKLESFERARNKVSHSCTKLLFVKLIKLITTMFCKFAIVSPNRNVRLGTRRKGV